MPQTHTLIIGASIAGLAMAASLQKQGIAYTLIEKEAQAFTSWRNHYHRLHLHTNKSMSHLPYKKFESSIPRYPSRRQVVEYLETYLKEFNIQPVVNTAATSIKKVGEYWMTETNNGSYQSKYVIIATGIYGQPKPVQLPGMETYTGKILHSYGYKTGADYKSQRVLVIGFGNSACEIAMDLYEQGATPAMSVRSAVNVIPRDVFGIPILQLGLWLSALPPRLSDKLNAPLLKLLTGDITKLGLKKLPYGPLEQIQTSATVPVLDIGTLQHIRQGHIKIYGGLSHISGSTVHFTDGQQAEFDTIVAAIGYNRNYNSIIETDTTEQKHFGADGLYFCGFRVSPTGQFREIGMDAQKIAADIATKNTQH